MTARSSLKHLDTLPGPVLALATSGDKNTLYAVYRNPKKWWQFWKPEIAVKAYVGEQFR